MPKSWEDNTNVVISAITLVGIALLLELFFQKTIKKKLAITKQTTTK